MKQRSEIVLGSPLPWSLLLAYLTPRLIPGFEQVDANAYTRRVGAGTVCASLAPGADRLLVEINAPISAAEACSRLTHLFALDEDHATAIRHLRKSAVLKPRIAR
ncbi:MAG: hypothetical protein M3O62_17725, partial [Pseudomonadota bacterium]|nr:hypothetical protein [Pseudomonadota bacterium]